MEELTPAEEALIVEAFGILDKEADGSVTIRELATVLRALGKQPTDSELQDMISEVDFDGNGSIELPEFVSMIVRKLRETHSEDELREAFQVYDKDKSGSIAAADIKAVMTTLGMKTSDDEIEELIREADFDQDGRWSFEEFVYMMTQP